MCGIFGIMGHPEAANLAYLGLYALQHRGQESAGIVSCEGTAFHEARHMGQVAEVFPGEVLRRLRGDAAIGHVRYSTSGSSELGNAQPFRIRYHAGEIAIAHNGNLTNAGTIRKQLETAGSIFQTSSDTEVILHLVARCRLANVEEALVDALRKVEGAYSIVVIARDRVIAARDPHGFRPLCIGRLDGSVCFASETCAFDLIGAEFVRDVEPGEIVVAERGGVRSVHPFPPAPAHRCIFEFVYFSRPDSRLFGQSVSLARKRMGAEMAMEQPAEADIVVPVPDSGMNAALGFSEKSGIPLEFGLIRNHYVGRTFIEPQQSIRHFGVKIKLNPARDLIAGKRVVLVDDSIVRGTTSRKIVTMVREAGAREIHVRISCPPTIAPCFYGVDTPLRAELIAANNTVDEIRRFIGADSLGYLSLEGLRRAVGSSQGFCAACYSNDYPVPVEGTDVAQMKLFEKPRR